MGAVVQMVTVTSEVNRINVFKPFEPVSRLNVPVVKEDFEAGGKLERDREDVGVRMEQ